MIRRRCEVQAGCETPRNGYFLGLGCDYEQLDDGVGIFPVGIVEFADGHLKSIYVGNIKLLDTETFEFSEAKKNMNHL